MNVQLNNFQGIYGKMALSQKRQQKQFEMLSQKTDSLQDNAYSPAKTGNTLSPYHAFERMKNAGPKSRTYNLEVQAKGTLREVENDRYLIEKSDEIEGYWRIYDKQFDKTFMFDPSNTTLQTDKNTNRYYLMADGPIGGLMDAIPADAKLMSTLSQFLNVESADSILTVSLNDKYTITVDAFTGIECLQVKGNEGKGSWLMIRDEQQLEKLQELADIYKKKYPNLVKTDGVAMGFAQSEVAGFSVRTENGILSIASNGMEYMDDADPSKSWAVHYSGTDGNMYMEIMNAMAEGYIVGKDIEEYSAWEKYFEKKGLEFVKVLSDEEIEALENSLTAEQLAALTGEYPVSESDLPNPTASETGVPERSASEYEEYKTAHYRIVPDNEAGCFDLYNEDGERIGAFDYADIKVRRDSATGRRFLISEHGSMSYDALPLDSELEQALQNVMGVDALETEELQGFTLKRHSDTGIRYLVRDGEEGRGGKVLLESEKDRQAYEALAQTYLNCYPNLIDSMEEAYIWADLEIKGLAQHTKDGFLSMGFDGMSYHDNADAKKNWSVMFSEDTYQAVTAWLQENEDSIRDIQEFATWQEVFEDIGVRYEQILPKTQKQERQRVTEPTSYYVNPNTWAFTTDIKNTIIKDPETFDPQHLLNPIDDMMQVLNTPIKLAKSPFFSKINNSVNIAAGQRIPVNDGHVLTVKTQGIEVSGGNNPYDTQAYIKAQQMADSLTALLRNACGTLKYMGYSKEEHSWYTEGITNVLSYLGIDTSKKFTVNGMKYHKDKNGWYESEANREAQEAYERLQANNRTYRLADEKTKKRIAHISNYYLETAPESVKAAWQETMEETNANPFPDGFASTFTKLSMEQDFRTGGDDNLLGDTEQSCLAAINQVLERIENLTGTVTEKHADFLRQEKAFYTALASKIGA